MEPGAPKSHGLLARPGQVLVEHLKNTSALCSEIGKKKISIAGESASGIVADIARLMGFAHDLGKAGGFFQEYLRERDERKKRDLKSKEETRHSLLSSLFTYRIVSDRIARGGLSEHPIFGLLPGMAFLAVKRHHGDLQNIEDEILSLDTPGTLRVVRRQLDSIAPAAFDAILSACPEVEFDLFTFERDIEDLVRKGILSGEKKRWREYRKNAGPDVYLLFQLLYSTLLNADKHDAILGKPLACADLERPCLPVDLVDRYRRKRFRGRQSTNGIDSLRNLIYEEVTSAAHSLDLGGRVYSINVPTGTGKTLTSLSFALKLRDRIGREEGFMPKVIYCLPYLSIIEQNFSVFEDIFKLVEGRKPDSRTLLKHHHLAEIVFRYQDDEAAPPDESLFLIEGWESEIVVTTFMQLFHTLISNRNRMLRKFKAMVNSIVILDEVQTIPYRYWHLVRTLFLQFAESFQTRFVFMTATQPLIFHHDEITELVSASTRETCARILDRITFVNRSRQTLSIDEFKIILRRDILAHSTESFLVVLNTIRCSIDVFQDIQRFVSEEVPGEVELYYLSTNIIPRHRMERIEAIRKSGNRRLVVSTQLVEAGVDIDVDRVYRDFAPLDSLNQVAGRCNRNFAPGKKGVVVLYSLRNEHEFYKYVYGRNDLTISKTADVLEDKTDLSEREFLALGLDYFERLKDSKSDDRSEFILNLLNTLRFTTMCEEEGFHLIEGKSPVRDLFIEIDGTAERVWNLYEEARQSKDPIARKQALNGIKRDLYDHVISVPANKAPSTAADWEIVHVSKAQVPFCYDEETGFRRSDPGMISV